MSARTASLSPEDQALLASCRKALADIWADPVFVRHISMSRASARALERSLTSSPNRVTRSPLGRGFAGAGRTGPDLSPPGASLPVHRDRHPVAAMSGGSSCPNGEPSTSVCSGALVSSSRNGGGKPCDPVCRPHSFQDRSHNPTT